MLLNSVTTLSNRHTEIDTARRYGNGTSETMLSELDLRSEAYIDMKYLPAFCSNAETAIPEGWGTSLFLLPLQQSKCQCALTDLTDANILIRSAYLSNSPS